MSQNNAKRIHLIYSIILAVLIVTLGVLLVLSCLDIYHSSERDPYSPDAIALRYDRIRILVYVTIFGIVGGVAMNLIFPLEWKRPKAVVQERILLTRLQTKALAAKENDRTSLEELLKKYRSMRHIFTLIPFAISAFAIIYPVIYFRQPQHFTIENLNQDILKSVLVVMVPALLCLGCFFIFHLLIQKSIRNEIECLKKMLEGYAGKLPNIQTETIRKNVSILWCIRGGLLLFAGGLILIGILNGGADDVLKKAVAICTECIGLG